MPEPLADFYRRYNARCNAHDFATLGEFVAEDVAVDGEPAGLPTYRANLEGWAAAFPDFRWELLRLLVQDDWIAAHFRDTGTHRGTFLGVPATGRAVLTREFAFYRVAGGRIAEVWGTVDQVRLLEQLRGEG